MKMKALLYYRSKLDAHDQAIYDLLVEQWMHFEDSIHISEPHCDFSVLTQAIHFDYPILFYVNYYHIVYSASVFGINIKGDYLFTRSETESLLQKCEQWVKYVCSHVPTGIGDAEKALWLHDVILNNVKYGDSNGLNAHNIIGVIQDGISVCEGISMAYKFLCDYADIPCIYLSGTLNGSPHGWNMIWINNETSFVDVTNDISSFPGRFGRNNFLRNSREMAGYTWDSELIPECRLTNKSNSYISAHSSEEVAAIISQMKNNDGVGIHLEFGHPLSEREIQQLILTCTFRCPGLFAKKVSFSQERQMLFVQNGPL